MPNKYYPCNSSFTKGFTGGGFKFNGLNTVKTLSQVHNGLNDMWLYITLNFNFNSTYKLSLNYSMG